jgi:hypothetical protein
MAAYWNVSFWDDFTLEWYSSWLMHFCIINKFLKNPELI